MSVACILMVSPLLEGAFQFGGQFILDLSKEYADRSIIVVIPELVEDRWYEYFLHNQRGRLLEWMLLVYGNEHIFTVTAPWYVGERR